MNSSHPSRQACVIYVAFDGSKEDLDSKLNECIAQIQSREHPIPAMPPKETIVPDDEPPFWTWFIPNPRPERQADL
jgi:hypothetical protein